MLWLNSRHGALKKNNQLEWEQTVIKVVLIDDHFLVRTGFRQLIESEKGIQVIGEAGTGVEGVQIVRATKPDVVILDIKLPDISGLEVTHKLLTHEPRPKILIISGMTSHSFPYRLLEAGALGYLTKNASQEELIRAIRAVHNNQRYIGPEIAQQMALAKLNINTPGDFSILSDRETEVMMMVVHGLGVKEIAQRLHLSSKTVHSYRSRIFEKLRVKNDTALTLLAIRKELVSIEELEGK